MKYLKLQQENLVFTIIYQSHHANDQWLILGNADGDFNAL